MTMTPDQYTDLGKIAIVILACPLGYYVTKVAIKLLKVKKKENPIRLVQRIRSVSHAKCHKDQLKKLRILTDRLAKVMIYKS